jgi:hypothetical protein
MQVERNKPEVAAPTDKFDLITHHWNAQGILLRKNPYIMYVLEGNQYFERPVNSGNLWHGNNQPAGRVEKTFAPNGAVTSKKFDFTAPHKEFTPKLEGDDALKYQLENAAEENESLKRELAAIKKDREQDPYKRSEQKAPELTTSPPTLTKTR